MCPPAYVEPVAATSSCPRVIDLGDTCDLDALTKALPAGCSIDELFPVGADGVERDVVAELTELCKYDWAVQFGEIQGSYQKDKNFFDGGGNPQGGEHASAYEFMAPLTRFIDNSMYTRVISWPEYAQREEYNAANGYGVNGYSPNFNIDPDADKGSCKMNTAMCCFTESIKDVENTDVCRHDLSTSPQSNHINYGWSIFDEDLPAYCVGFTWDEGTDSDFYKGNALFYASLYQTAVNEYTGNIPGAPMCACLEQMPVVTEAACVTASGTNLNYQLTILDGKVGASHSVSMTYADCGDDLSTHVKRVHAGNADIVSKIGNHLVGANQCQITNEEYLNDEQLLLPTAESRAFSSMALAANYEGIVWKQLFGEGIYFLPPKLDPKAADEEMRTAMTSCGGRYCLIIRKCESCTSDAHKEIVYKRLTELPPYQEGISTPTTLDLPNLFMNQWRRDNNEMHVDYELYSSVSDALNSVNEWQVADYNNNDHTYGFPRNSGPNRHHWNQWNSYKRGGADANHHGYYVEVLSAV